MIRKIKSYKIILIFLLFASFFFTRKRREGFTENNIVGGEKNIVLLGDSVFFNDPYVKVGNSVCDKLKKR